MDDDGFSVDLETAVQVTGFSAVAGVITGEDFDGDPVELDAVVLSLDGNVDGLESNQQFIVPIEAWDGLYSCGVEAIAAHRDGLVAASTPAGIAPGGDDEASRWADFEARLAGVLDVLDPGEFLVIESHTGRFVQVMVQGDAIRAETVSNQYLPDEIALPYDDLQLLENLGWYSPTQFADEEAGDGDGSPNHWIDIAAEPSRDELAALFVQTLRAVHQVAEPEDLTYLSSDSEGNRIMLPDLGLSRNHR